MAQHPEKETFIPEETFVQNGGTRNGFTPANVQKEPLGRKGIIKNLLLISSAFVFLFTAFQSLQNLQSSLNKEEGLGTVSLSVLYACGVLAGLFLPPLVITRLGCKWTLVCSMATYITFMAANLYPVWATMIPASVIIGLGAATLWAAKCTYLTQLATWYSEERTRAGMNSLFFGVFFAFFQTSQIWGNLISSTVFAQGIPENYSLPTEEVLVKCGANYCPTDYQNNTNLDRPNMTKIYTVCGIYIGCGVLAVAIIAFLVDNITVETDGRTKTTLQLLSSIAKHFGHSKCQLLLIPITVYSGVEQAFIAGDYTRSFVSCSIGIWNVGYVMIAYGVADASASFLIGRLVKYTGFIPWFLLTFVLHGGSLIAMLLWSPGPDHVFVFYVLAVIWGIGDAVIQTLVNAYYGTLFTNKPETAFASYRLCESAGFILCFGYSGFICTDVKIFVCLGLITLGTVSYLATEVIRRRRS